MQNKKKLQEATPIGKLTDNGRELVRLILKLTLFQILCQNIKGIVPGTDHLLTQDPAFEHDPKAPRYSGPRPFQPERMISSKNN